MSRFKKFVQNALASNTPVCQNVEPGTFTINNNLLLKIKDLTCGSIVYND